MKTVLLAFLVGAAAGCCSNRVDPRNCPRTKAARAVSWAVVVVANSGTNQSTAATD